MYRIVIADDEWVIREGLRRTIPWESFDCEIVGEAEDGIGAWEQIECSAPDILLTDIRMPGCDGLDLATQVSRHYPQVKIVFLTGFGEFAYAQKAIKVGAADYILKPTDPDELMKIIRRITGEIAEERRKVDHMKRLEWQIAMLNGTEEQEPPALQLKEKYDFSAIDDYLERHYDEDISLQEVASIVHMSEGHFCRQFKKQTGLNFVEYLTKIRVEKAKPLLADLSLKIYEVSERVGYQDSRYFSQIFRKVTGETPTEFRKQLQQT
ncbi:MULTISPECIES: response regulator [unclassified Paenibacillus]|uniref:response regulator transcription factor n=1 Tax=unclassified Paenibacillus TaxID=185978 RepID=UPI001C11A489|nr:MULTISPECIES: response regulator [unclassified Paenibacillus]MBU5442812.1 response regulator [Paenibacillus sp. MSJ-34]CAH0117885.1 putative response regulatory protein [Paenibacillus sp. CECT 9249]